MFRDQPKLSFLNKTHVCLIFHFCIQSCDVAHIPQKWISLVGKSQIGVDLAAAGREEEAGREAGYLNNDD